MWKPCEWCVMTRVLSQTYSDRKLELFTGELRLVKGAMELMSLRLELVLAEIADFDHGPASQELNSTDAAAHGIEPEEIRTQDCAVEVVSEFEPALIVTAPPVAIELSCGADDAIAK